MSADTYMFQVQRQSIHNEDGHFWTRSDGWWWWSPADDCDLKLPEKPIEWWPEGDAEELDVHLTTGNQTSAAALAAHYDGGPAISFEARRMKLRRVRG